MIQLIAILISLIPVHSFAESVFDEIDDYKFSLVTCYADVRHNYDSKEELNDAMLGSRGICKVVADTPVIWAPLVDENDVNVIGSEVVAPAGYLVKYTTSVLYEIDSKKAAWEMLNYCNLHDYQIEIEKVKVHKCTIEKLF